MIFNFLADPTTTDPATNPTQLSFWEGLLEKLTVWAQTKGVRLLIGIIALFIIFKIINAIARGVKKRMLKKKRDETITNVVYEVIRKVSKIIVFIFFLGFIGFDTSGIGSIVAACAVAIGLALQGSLSNIAGWFIIIFMRPFKFGDYIACQGTEGTVEDIKLFYTYLKTVDNKVVMVPNGALANGNITNFSVKKTRRVDYDFMISYGDDANKAIMLIENIAKEHDLILKDQEYFVKIKNLDSSGIILTTRVWVNQKDYWSVYFDLISQVKEAFDKNGITVPYNQIDIHVINNK